MTAPTLAQRLLAEALGSALLAAAVIGSGVMAERLAGGNVALALLANTLATMAALYALIVALGGGIGAQFNPVVTLAALLRRRLPAREAAATVVVQILAMIAGCWLVHAMFDLPLLQVSAKARDGVALVLAEAVATFGLLLVILMLERRKPEAVPAAVACWIGAAYWFTASIAFANPAITIARVLSDSFAGIAPADARGFVAGQTVGALSALLVARRFGHLIDTA